MSRRPGMFAICTTCANHARDMAHQGHPRPCKAVGWEGPRLIVPQASHFRCDSFQPLEETAAAPATDWESEVNAPLSTENPADSGPVLPEALQQGPQN